MLKSFLLILLCMVTTLTCNAPAIPLEEMIVYEIFVRSFYDSDGDGIGDLKGVEMKLDYIQSLGANTLWLMPVFQSPSDHCYDVVNYFEIEDDYGTMDDFESLAAACKKRDMRIILDLVLNHTSSQHPWFLKSLEKEPPYDHYYIWRNELPGGEWFVYNTPGKVENGGWRHHKVRDAWFYAYFTPRMPDLNLENPKVRKEVKAIADFWLDKGVSGFRLDAAQNMIEEGPGEGKQYDSQSTVDWWVEFNQHIKSKNPNAVLVGEIWADPPTLSRYYAGGRGLDLCFNFPLQKGILATIQHQSADTFQSVIRQMKAADAPYSYFAPFLSNHDQQRYMTTLEKEFDLAKLATVLLLTAPGAPFMYYGEEVGMHQSNFTHGTTRTPMQWTGDEGTAGFTTADAPWKKPGHTADPFNVAHQLNDKESLLEHYKRLIALRWQEDVFRYGEYEFYEMQNSVLAFDRIHNREKVTLILNLSGDTQQPDVRALQGRYVDLIHGGELTIQKGFELAGHAFHCLKKIKN